MNPAEFGSRAALVYALTEDGQGSNQYGSSIDEKSSKLSISALAEKGINGLGSRETTAISMREFAKLGVYGRRKAVVLPLLR